MKGSEMKRIWGGAALLLGTLALTLNASAGQFNHAVYYHAGQRPYQVIATHLTDSGNLDLVVANLTSQIFVLLGNGDGTFQQPIKLSIPSPVALAVGDFNGDGKEDLAVAEYGGTGKSAVAVLLGDGTGRFRVSATYPSGVETTGVTVADFNGDGHDDVAIADNIGTVKVFFGTGKGTLRKPTTYKLPGTNPISLAAGDLNGDGHPDIAVAEAIGGSIAVLLNDGTGKFFQPVTYNAGGGEVVDVKIADLRHDGKQDLVIANFSQGMVVLLNEGNGTFAKPTIYTPTFFNWQPPEACVVADFNLDGKLDVACAAHLNDAYVFYGKGDGTFKSGVEIHETINHQGGFSIATGDFNDDGAPDLAIPIEQYGKVAILLNTQ
jgi:FG-GAP-like repeat